MQASQTKKQHTEQQGLTMYATLPPTYGQPTAHPVTAAVVSPSGQHQFAPHLPPYVAYHHQPEQEPPWVNRIIQQINNNKEELVCKIGEVAAKVTQLESEMRGFHELKQKVCNMGEQMAAMWDQVERIRNDCLYEKGRSMRDNLLFHGVKEQRDEDPETVVRTFLTEKLQLDGTKMEFMRCHRLGTYNPNKQRPIVTKFLRYTEKELVKKTGYEKLRRTGFGVSDQYPQEINDRRKLLVPVMRKIKEEKGHAAKAALIVDTLYSDDFTYTVQNGEVKRAPRAPRQRRGYDGHNHNNKQNRPHLGDVQTPGYLRQQVEQIANHHNQHTQFIQQRQHQVHHQPHQQPHPQPHQQPHQPHQQPHQPMEEQTTLQHVRGATKATPPSNMSSTYVHNAWTKPAPPVVDQSHTSTTDLLNTDVTTWIPNSHVPDTHISSNNLNTTAAHLTNNVSDPHSTNNSVNPEVDQSGAATTYNVTNTPRTEVTCWNAPLEELASTSGTLTQVDPLTVPQSDTAWPELP